MSTQFEGLVPGTYVIDASHSEVGFTVRHLVGKVRGQFREFEGSLEIAEQPLESSVSATIELSSVDTRNNDRDNHLRSADFFSVESTPKMSFRSTGLKEVNGQLVASGDLTIRETTNPVELELEYQGTGGDPWGGTRVAFEAHTVISRKEGGVDFTLPAVGESVVIGDKITVVIAIEAVLQQDQA